MAWAKTSAGSRPEREPCRCVEARSPTLAYRFEHGLLEGPVIDDEDALGELLDRAVAPPQVREEILKAARTGRYASHLGSGAGRTKSRAGPPGRRPRVRSG
jgi:hypothetical protein